jgi:hypothetical protein
MAPIPDEPCEVVPRRGSFVIRPVRPPCQHNFARERRSDEEVIATSSTIPFVSRQHSHDPVDRVRQFQGMADKGLDNRIVTFLTERRVTDRSSAQVGPGL